MSLRDELAEVEALAETLRRRIAAETSCAVRGHRMKHIGGMNAGCDDQCSCSIPVHECLDCGDCDYGDNDESQQTMADCAEKRQAMTAPIQETDHG